MSARPSNIGTRFHNYLYEALGLDFVYKAFAPADIEFAVHGIRGLGIRGAAVSMPFKEVVIPMLDGLDPSAAAIASVNTIVNDSGTLIGHNTDYAAVKSLLADQVRSRDLSVAVIGSGGMAKAVVAAVRDLGFDEATVVARNAITGQQLAEQYGYQRIAKLDGPVDVIINATSVGMTGGPEADSLPIDAALIAGSSLVFDVVAVPAETPLIREARGQKIPVVIGTDVMTLQAVEQFVLYTGVRPSAELITAAAEFSRVQ